MYVYVLVFCLKFFHGKFLSKDLKVPLTQMNSSSQQLNIPTEQLGKQAPKWHVNCHRKSAIEPGAESTFPSIESTSLSTALYTLILSMHNSCNNRLTKILNQLQAIGHWLEVQSVTNKLSTNVYIR